jgi:hypothetical protein
MLTQATGVIDVVKFLKSEYLNYAHTLFAAVCDTMLLHKTLKAPGSKSAKAHIDAHRVHATIRGTPNFRD